MNNRETALIIERRISLNSSRQRRRISLNRFCFLSVLCLIGSRGMKQHFSRAIVEQNQVVVDVATIDDNSVVALHPDTIEALQLFSGATILIKGKEGKDTICIASADVTCEELSIKMNRVVRSNLRVKPRDIVSIHKFSDVKHGNSVLILPMHDTMQWVTRNLFNPYLKNYFLVPRPVRKGDCFFPRGTMGLVEFKIIETDPAEYCMVEPSTEILCEGEPIKRDDEIRLDEIGYDDVGGLRKQIAQIRDLVELPLRHPLLSERIGVKPPRGILLYGPPGCGKSFLANAVANETGAFFHVISGPEIISKLAEESEINLAKDFDEAEKNGPSIILIDEIDSIAPKRKKTHGEVESAIVSQLLSLMDGPKSCAHVIVIGTTKRANSIHPDLRRLFDIEIEIGVPDEVGRLEILGNLTKFMMLAEDVNLERIAKDTRGYVGADLATMCRMAFNECVREQLSEYGTNETDAEILNSMAVANKHFCTVLELSYPSALRYVIEVPNVTWQDIGGLENVKRELKKAVRFSVVHPEKLEKCGMFPLKGLLFYGPPGCGKTLLAKAIANECQAKFISIKGSELLTMWCEEGETNVREIFDKARGSTPCVLFFDELDLIAAKKGSSVGDAEAATNMVLNQLLQEMDRMSAKQTVLIIGATNTPNIIDPAVLCSGRINQWIYVPLPEEESRFQIFKACLSKYPSVSKDVDLRELARHTDGFSGSDIALICHKAHKYAIEDRVNSVPLMEQYLSGMFLKVKVEEIKAAHFHESMKYVKNARKSVSDADIMRYQEFPQTVCA